ncbi:alpha-glucosidase [Blautia wexlerae]|jgi:oligo-1,6-glucosidase|uniref:Oligo-1,6-glucosidase n=1 Tax=Blautia wexlerae TaxID=418240 RepID=A0A174APA7_9FIRM|nr:alpha-glucosidase [Blautia wexlerae]RHD94160.1 alpha-glucosidase [Ruminococcus sp. AM30-15AC]RHT52959.1 alpha-glucosidase [Ruminococcus sp. AM29-26]RHU90793.1 alpha-glucosidase [Ruminococcus sp. OM08-7]MCB5686702.1 alpha-glucosidase [Blautia wexlerae]NSD00675.1 alpha-glucosidase [Blautia wexlerae]
MEKRWWKESVVYQIYPRSFCDSNGDGIGDLNGITSKLDYLKELGVDVIWLSPVYKSPNDDNGYDISDYQDIMDEFGTMEDFDRMLATAHEKGIKIMMDLVVNHTSDEHKWFIESRKSTDNPYRDYYIWRPAKEDGSLPNNWGSCFSGPAWEYDKTTDMYFLHLFSKKQPDLNWDNPVVRQEVFDMMNWWLEKGVDGFRMDVISLISKEQPELPDKEPGINGYATFNVSANGPHVHEYLQEMRQKALNNADTITVGECSGVTLEEAKKYARSDEKELNMVFQFEHMDVDSDEKAGKWTTRKMDLRDLKKILTRWQKGLQDIAWNSLYWENHDQPRSVSRFGNDSDEYREISAKMLATCIHMMQGTPYVYQGEELGMTNCPFNTLENFRDLESINAFHELTEQGKMTEEEMMAAIGYKGRDNARTPMQWDDSANAGFSDASATPWIMVNPNYTKINAKDQVSREDSVFKYYQKLIKLRHESDLIVYGTYDLILDDDKDIYAYIRTLGDEKLIVYCNFSENTREVELPEEFTDGKILISNYNDAKVSEKITLRPYEAIVIQK